MLHLKSLIAFLFILVCQLSATAQIGSIIGNRSTPISNKTIEVTITPSATLPLAKRITRSCETDSKKVEAIFNWIATHISYDNELHNSVTLQKKFYTSEEKVIAKALERKKALCGGYAFLFKQLCEDIGIRAEVIHGFTKSTQPRRSKQPNHSWNAVLLNGKWQLLDLTWAVSFGTNSSPSKFWYGTHPSDFIKSHYPQHSKWTLQRNPISFREFNSQ